MRIVVLSSGAHCEPHSPSIREHVGAARDQTPSLKLDRSAIHSHSPGIVKNNVGADGGRSSSAGFDEKPDVVDDALALPF